jgi:hypothetical protein
MKVPYAVLESEYVTNSKRKRETVVFSLLLCRQSTRFASLKRSIFLERQVKYVFVLCFVLLLNTYYFSGE